MTQKRRTRLAGQGLRALSLTPTSNRTIMRRSMSSGNAPQLWRPGTGIRFSPRSSSSRLYPDIGAVKAMNVPRSMSTQEPGPSSSLDQDANSPESAFGHGARQGQTVSTPVSSNRLTQRQPQEAPKPPATSSSGWSFLAPNATPVTNLDYTLSRARYDAAKKSEPSTPSSFWSHTLYEKTNEDGSVQNVKVHYCTSKHTMESVCERYFQNEPVLGFDMEWMSHASRTSGPRQNVSLIQIASPSRIALFHIALFPKDDFVSSAFKKLMEDSSVIKAGVNILADATRLRKVLGVDMTGVLEVSHLYNLILCSKTRRPGPIPKKAVSMEKQAQDCFGLPLFKEQDVRAGNWMSPLSSRQLQYAATDAYAGLQLYHVLEQHRLQLKPCPPRPHLAELRRPIEGPVVEADEEPADESVEEDFIDETITDEDLLTLENAMIVDGSLPVMQEPASKPDPSRLPEVRLSLADAMVQSYTLASKPSARPAALRAYYVWHENEDMSPAAVASLLRDPPLQTNTVVTYILDAVTAEQLPYSKTRMANEVLSQVHSSAIGRYQELAKECDFRPVA